VFGNPITAFADYVENLIDAMQMAAASGEGLRQFNVVDDDELTLGRYHEVRRSVDGSATASVPPGRCASQALSLSFASSAAMGDTGYRNINCVGPGKIAGTTPPHPRRTGWRPRVPLLEAVQRTVNARRL